jgi:flagellar basal-body rod protein FlgB
VHPAVSEERNVLRDVTGDYLKVALRGLSLQRQASVDNLANVETPGYQAKRVDFESALRRAFTDRGAPTLAVSQSVSDSPAMQNGNNVAVDDELLMLSDNALRQQLVVESLNSRYRVLRTAIGG